MNVSKEEKQEVVNILIKNMKTVYKNLDLSKINNKNFDSVFDQYKKHSVMETINEIKKSKQPSTDMKFKRDFTSVPTQQNKVMERPQSTKNNFEGFSSNMNNYESNLDQVFKPIVPNATEQQFNNYNSNKPKDTASRMEDVQKARQSEMAARNQRPPTPDFLKSQKSNPDKDMPSRNNTNNSTRPIARGDKPDFVNMNSDEMNQGFQGLSNDTGGDLYSLDNFDKQLIDVDMTEDNSSFEDRLKRLQNERGNMKPTTSNNMNQAVDFTSENFPKTENMGNNIIQQPVQRIQSQQDIPKQQSTQRMQRTQTQNDIPKQRIQQEIFNQNTQESDTDSLSEPVDKFSMIRNSMKSVNIELVEDTKKFKQLEQENIELKELVRQFTETNSLEKLNTIKKQIADEFEELKNKNDIITMKEVELAKKEAEIKQLIVNYDYLFKSSQLQFEVTSKENKTNYIWNMKTIPNVMGIKLMSYSLPLPRFNVEDNKNNILKIKIEDTVHDIIIKNGKYNIDDLVESINSIITNMKLNIKMSVNSMQHIVIESTDNDFTLVSTPLAKDILGFINNSDNTTKIISDRIWDLRVEDKVYLFLNNLSDTMPFGVLYFNGNSSCNFRFEKPYNMENLEIVFKDSKGYDFNFHNLPHSLSFMVDRLI